MSLLSRYQQKFLTIGLKDQYIGMRMRIIPQITIDIF